MVLLYFGSKACGVCTDMQPKIEELLKNYPLIKSFYIDVEKSHKLAISWNIFTIPGLLVYIEGKEFIREARHISVGDIDRKINRYYSMIF